ncbi:MAG: hypothetical protein JST59_28790 [Actinobacteria bacterium]|nr:hypothetical protein [Actinomycetota bacterium]
MRERGGDAATASRSVTALFSVYSDPGDVIAAASALARERTATLELVAYVPTLHLFLQGMGALVAPAGLTAGQFERDLAREVAARAATVPADVPVSWRLFCCGRRRAIRRLFGARRRGGPLFLSGLDPLEDHQVPIERVTGTSVPASW